MLFNSGNEVNTIYSIFIKELRLLIRPTNIRAQKINGIKLNIYRPVVGAFSEINKANRVKFFEETFLMANISPKVITRISFFTLSSANVDFLDQKLW